MRSAVLHRRGEPETTFDVSRPRTLGSGEHDDLSVGGLDERAVLVSTTVGGLLVEARTPTTVGGRLVPPRTRRLVRPGEQIEGDGWALWPGGAQPEPDGTRAVLAAVLAGEPVAASGGPGVTVLEGLAAGRRFAVVTAAEIGRSRRADVPLDDPLASRRHLVLERLGGAVWARDLGSKNGFRVWRRDGASLRASRIRGGRVRLVAGDELEIGRTLIAYDEVQVPLTCPLPRGGKEDVPIERGRAVRAAVVLASIALLAAAALLAHAAA